MKISLLMIVVLVVVGCNLDHRRLASINHQYDSLKSYFNIEYTSHFPKKLTSFRHQYLLNADIYWNHPKFWLKIFPTEIDYDSILFSAKQMSIASYNGSDSCLVLLDSHLKVGDVVPFDRRKPLNWRFKPVDCENYDIPVPKFWEENWKLTEETKSGLTSDYEYYVLDVKNGIVMDSTKIPDGKYAPEGWEHGMSRGVVVSSEDRVVIYWVDIW